jgi:hypothetical protein
VKVNEWSTCSFTAYFYGADGQPSAPSSVQWRLRDVSSNVVLQDWTSLATGATTVEVNVPADLNVIVNDRNRYEDHAIAIRAEVGEDGQYIEELIYQVKNLQAFRSS